ncbi:MAG: CDC27 family protein [Muribaculaceae bacterium]|nr:CDC27 family protein [Muribaculaceae bacterium]
MEKNNVTPQEVEQSEALIAKARANKKTILGLSIAAFAIVIIALVWLLVAQSGERKADELIAKADLEQNDSIAMNLYAEAAKAGYKSGNRAEAELGIRLYRQGKYEEALKHLKDADLNGSIAPAGVYSLMGDCYVNLDQYDKALDCYQDAISKADKNPELVPLFLIKEANIYHAQQKYAAEAKCYKTILEDYPTYAATTRTDLRKYYERAAALAK